MKFPRALLFPLLVTRLAALEPWQVAVLYNSNIPESVELAEAYANAREIPADRLVGLPMPDKADITRDEYETTIRGPLIRHFDHAGWWQRGRTADGASIIPVENRIRAVAVMRGTPLRIKPTPKPEDETTTEKSHPLDSRDEASVDSELAMFGIEGLPVHGILQNRYFQSEQGFADASMPFMVLTSRIDGPSLAICKRMIADAIQTEPAGLWGMAYVDIANKFPLGDKWLEEIVNANRNSGIPTVIDRFDATLPDHYPMQGAALYYGWYDHHVSGPLLNPRFRFRRGAVAVHIHSFSAAQLHNPARNWCAPLIAAGAAATLGNVYEPYLHLSHHLGVFHDRLLRGFTLVEAAWMAMPCTSWQGVVIGDPLYRPFMHFPERGEIREEDRDFRALAVAMKTWRGDERERQTQLASAVDRTKSGTLAEALALEAIETRNLEMADAWLERALSLHASPADQIRIAFHRASHLRRAGKNPEAVTILRDASALHAAQPEAKALDAWINLLDAPPAPEEP